MGSSKELIAELHDGLARNDAALKRTNSEESDEARMARIFEAVSKRIAELGTQFSKPFSRRIVPDVIVTPAENVFLFEPQSWRVAVWFHRYYGTSMENFQMFDQIRVHPCRREKLMDELMTAGFEVNCLESDTNEGNSEPVWENLR